MWNGGDARRKDFNDFSYAASWRVWKRWQPVLFLVRSKNGGRTHSTINAIVSARFHSLHSFLSVHALARYTCNACYFLYSLCSLLLVHSALTQSGFLCYLTYLMVSSVSCFQNRSLLLTQSSAPCHAASIPHSKKAHMHCSSDETSKYWIESVVGCFLPNVCIVVFHATYYIFTLIFPLQSV